MLRPDQAGPAPWPLIPAGPVLYLPEDGRRPAQGNRVTGISLRPGQAIEVGIPVRFTDACYTRAGWTGLDVFYVQEGFLGFTHWVAIPLGTLLIFHEPQPRGAAAICPGK